MVLDVHKLLIHQGLDVRCGCHIFLEKWRVVLEGVGLDLFNNPTTLGDVLLQFTTGVLV